MSDSKHDTRTDDVQRTAPAIKDGGSDGATKAGVTERLADDGPRMQAGQDGPAFADGPGGMQRVEQLGTGTARAGRNVLRGAVNTTEELGAGIVGGAAHIATDLVHGVTDLGYEVRNGATGLIGAAGDIGSAAVHTVAGLLVDVVGGVRQVVAAAVSGHDQGKPMSIERPRPEHRA